MPDEKKSVAKLIKDYINGESSALEELMLLTYKELFLISYGYVKDKMLAEDAVSETFLKLITKIHTVKNDKNLNGYLRTIVINQSLDILRKRKNEVFPGDVFFAMRPANGGAENKASGILTEDYYVRQTLESMDSNQCEVLLLWQYDYTLHEISQKTDFTVNQVRLLLKKAKLNFSEKYHKNTR